MYNPSLFYLSNCHSSGHTTMSSYILNIGIYLLLDLIGEVFITRYVRTARTSPYIALKIKIKIYERDRYSIVKTTTSHTIINVLKAFFCAAHVHIIIEKSVNNSVQLFGQVIIRRQSKRKHILAEINSLICIQKARGKGDSENNLPLCYKSCA